MASGGRQLRRRTGSTDPVLDDDTPTGLSSATDTTLPSSSRLQGLDRRPLKVEDVTSLPVQDAQHGSGQAGVGDSPRVVWGESVESTQSWSANGPRPESLFDDLPAAQRTWVGSMRASGSPAPSLSTGPALSLSEGPAPETFRPNQAFAGAPVPDDKPIVQPREPLENAESPASSNEKQCRICLGGPQDEAELGQLFSPCRCKGTMKYVHTACLNRWRTSSMKREAFFECDQCHYKYNFNRARMATWLNNPVVITLVTLVTCVVLIVLLGFVAKLFGIAVNDWGLNSSTLDDESLEGEDDFVEAPSEDATEDWLWMSGGFWSLDVNHFVSGTIVFGMTGLIQLIVSIALHGMLPWNLPFPRGNNREGLNGTVLAILVIIGFLRALWSVFKVRMHPIPLRSCPGFGRFKYACMLAHLLMRLKTARGSQRWQDACGPGGMAAHRGALVTPQLVRWGTQRVLRGFGDAILEVDEDARVRVGVD